jgi:hypothetical protein
MRTLGGVIWEFAFNKWFSLTDRFLSRIYSDFLTLDLIELNIMSFSEEGIEKHEQKLSRAEKNKVLNFSTSGDLFNVSPTRLHQELYWGKRVNIKSFTIL